MLSGKLIAERAGEKMYSIIFSGVLSLLFIFTLSACTAAKGNIVILENIHGTGFTMELREFSSKNKCELFFNKGDVLQVEVVREDGKIDFSVNGKNGSEPYTGKSLKSGTFTISASETDNYIFKITGNDATGRITVKNLSVEVE